MAYIASPSGLTPSGDAPALNTPPPKGSAYGAFAVVLDSTFGGTVGSPPTTGCSAAAGASMSDAHQVVVCSDVAQDHAWAPRAHEASRQTTRVGEAAGPEKAVQKPPGFPEPWSSASRTLLRSLSDEELAHHLSQLHGDFTLQEVARRLHRLTDQLNEARCSQHQCHECGAFIQNQF
jgi:hypothetical protein